MTIQATTLKNGLRVVTDRVATVETVALGVWTSVGTRHENMRENGIAHMVEHMMFKGTPERDALQIAEVIEDVGGSMNAYTDREITAYYIHLMREHLDLALNVLADILQNSTMPEDEIERERGVILQEIKMYQDQPDRLVFDDFQQAAYPGQALGASTLGREDIIASISRSALMHYVAAHYSPDRLVIAAAGPVDHDAFVAQVEKAFAGLPEGEARVVVPALYAPELSLSDKPTEQSHIILGFNGVPRVDPRYSTARLLSSILGGGMSSRLFQEVREKRGLVYSVYSFNDAFSDDGLFGIHAGTGPEHLAEMMPVVIDEIRKIADGGVTEKEMNRAKAQIKSGVRMARESVMTRCDQQGRHMIYFGRTFEVANMIERIEAVDAQDVCNLAGEIFSTKPTLAAIGPLGGMMDYGSIEARLRG